MVPTAKSGGRAAALQRNLATFSNGPTRGAYTEIVRNGLGAGGIDYVEVFKTGSATSVRFPVYDGHGNMTACLLRDGAGGFTLTSRRAYDPWGAMRQWGTHPSGASAYQGAPSTRYVGALGHQQDDDSGLYYMRARYYEPGSGRFISEDLARDGGNWFAYCGNDPVARYDSSGKTAEDALIFITGSLLMAFGLFLMGIAPRCADGWAGMSRVKAEYAMLNAKGLDGEYSRHLGRQIHNYDKQVRGWRAGGAGVAGIGAVLMICAGREMIHLALLKDIELVGTEYDILCTFF